MSSSAVSLTVHKSVTVNAPRDRAFRVFTDQMTTWWPLANYHIGAANPAEALLEPKEGGRWFERGDDGSECDWGRVLVWDPPERVVLAWQITPDWTFDADPANQTEVEIRFIAEDARTTRVDLEHRGLERYGDRAEEMRGIFNSEGGWSGLLAAYAAATTG